jgi:CcmD family protein
MRTDEGSWRGREISVKTGGDMLSGLQSVMAAYLAVWAIFFGYQVTVSRRLRHLQDEVERLKTPAKR